MQSWRLEKIKCPGDSRVSPLPRLGWCFLGSRALGPWHQPLWRAMASCLGWTPLSLVSWCLRLATGPLAHAVAACYLGGMVGGTVGQHRPWFMVIKWIAVDDESSRNSTRNKIQLYALLELHQKVKPKRQHLEHAININITHEKQTDVLKYGKLRRANIT